eukprot:gene21133-biopygen16164
MRGGREGIGGGSEVLGVDGGKGTCGGECTGGQWNMCCRGRRREAGSSRCAAGTVEWDSFAGDEVCVGNTDDHPSTAAATGAATGAWTS